MRAPQANSPCAGNGLARLIDRYQPLLHRCRRNVLAGLAGAPCAAALTEHFERGKMLRPLLVFAAASAVGGAPGAAMAGAEAVELLHGASLVHDDIIDEAAERRGRPALHQRVGAGAALVLGDYLLLRAFAVLGDICGDVEPSAALRALNTLNRYALECCRGQVQELLPDDRLDPEAAFFRIVEGKTAAQFAAAATVGAILGGGHQPEIDTLHHYGLNVGVAFQIHDDLLDLVGQAEALGKPVGNSLAHERPLLPLIYLQKYGSPAARAEFARMQAAGLERRRLADLLAEEGLLLRAREVLGRYITAAQNSLNNLSPSEEVAALRKFPLYAVAWEG